MPQSSLPPRHQILIQIVARFSPRLSRYTILSFVPCWYWAQLLFCDTRGGRPHPTRYHKTAYDGEAIERLLVDVFLEAHERPPRQIILDLGATDDPLHGHHSAIALRLMSRSL